MKIGLIDSAGLICHDHPEASVERNARYCKYCGTELEQCQKEDAEMTFFLMTEEDEGGLTKHEINKLKRIVSAFSFPDEGHEQLIPQSSRAFGVYITDDDVNEDMRPPKVLGMVATRKKLKDELTTLRKHYKKVELKFGFMSDYC